MEGKNKMNRKIKTVEIKRINGGELENLKTLQTRKKGEPYNDQVMQGKDLFSQEYSTQELLISN